MPTVKEVHQPTHLPEPDAHIGSRFPLALAAAIASFPAAGRRGDHRSPVETPGYDGRPLFAPSWRPMPAQPSEFPEARQERLLANIGSCRRLARCARCPSWQRISSPARPLALLLGGATGCLAGMARAGLARLASALTTSLAA